MPSDGREGYSSQNHLRGIRIVSQDTGPCAKGGDAEKTSEEVGTRPLETSPPRVSVSYKFRIRMRV